MKEIESTECVITGETLKPNEKRQGTDTALISGIYKIINKINGKYYVGSSNDILSKRGRWKEHKYELNYKRHPNDHLQKSWNKYGEKNFEFVILERNLFGEQLRIREQWYLDIAKKEKNKTYNMSFISGRIDMTPETRAKISKYFKNYFVGSKHPMFDSKIYTFKNKVTNEIFRGNRYDFIKKFNLRKEHVCNVLKRKRKYHKDWSLLN